MKDLLDLADFWQVIHKIIHKENEFNTNETISFEARKYIHILFLVS